MKRTRVVFEIDEAIGLFATLYYVAAITRYSEEKGIDPWIIATNHINVERDRGRDWFDYFFERRDGITPAPADSPRHTIRNRRELNRLLRGKRYIDIQNEFSDIREAGDYFGKHLRIRREILHKAEEFARDRFDGKTLGIHYRGTDKPFDEADRVSMEQMREVVERHRAGYRNIFVATDDAEFTEYILGRFSSHNVLSRRSPSGLSHREDLSDNYRKGLEAMLDCLLLSKCDLLLKTPSQLSAWSKVFNPDLPVVLVGLPYKQHLLVLRQFLGIKPLKWWSRPLNFFGFFPESSLYNPDEQAMKRNRVIEIVNAADRRSEKRYA